MFADLGLIQLPLNLFGISVAGFLGNWIYLVFIFNYGLCFGVWFVLFVCFVFVMGSLRHRAGN